MTTFTEFRDAVVGWYEMLTARSEGARRFNSTRYGLGNALFFYLLTIIVTLGVQGLMRGLPGLYDVYVSVAVNALPLVGVAFAILLTIAALRLELTFTTLAVPAVYAMTFVLLLQLPLSLWTGDLLSNAILGILAYMFYREGRDVGKMSIGISIAFAALSIVMLVALPAALYMLVVPAAPPA
jgi:hypothetical protein